LPEEKPEPKQGKKEQANSDARTAHVGSEWEDDLRPRGQPQRPTLQ